MFMTTLRGALAAALLAAASVPAQAVTFNFLFDNTGSGTLTPPIVGAGTISFDEPAGGPTGTFSIASLTSFDLQFDFFVGSFPSFTEADIASTSSVVLSGTPGARSIVFDGPQDGVFVGSLDLVDGSNGLSFQPGGGTLYFLVDGGSQAAFGTFQGLEAGGSTAVPLPAGLPLLLTGLGALAVLRRRA